MNDRLIKKFITKKRFEKYKNIDTYNINLRKSKQFYIPLSILEVSLRNSINNLFEKLYGAGWIANEASFLKHKEIEKIIQTKDKILSRSEIISKDKIVSELSFGFWTALFQSVYDDKMRFNNLKHIFPNLPPKEKLPIDRKMVSTKLNHIRKFRNRIFHHENILKEEFKNIEDDIYEILSYFDNELVEFTKKANNG